MGADGEKSRKRMIVFRGADAVPLDSETMPSEAPDAGTLAALQQIAALGIDQEAGSRSRIIFKEPGAQGMSLVHVWFKSGYVLPRHSHDGDCLYYIIGGELSMGAHTLRKGDGMFLPGDHAYGYVAGPEGVELLEFRNATRFNIALKGNDDAHWSRVIETLRDRPPIWDNETAPPSER